jgi:hypothetical protein
MLIHYRNLVALLLVLLSLTSCSEEQTPVERPQVEAPLPLFSTIDLGMTRERFTKLMKECGLEYKDSSLGTEYYDGHALDEPAFLTARFKRDSLDHWAVHWSHSGFASTDSCFQQVDRFYTAKLGKIDTLRLTKKSVSKRWRYERSLASGQMQMHELDLRLYQFHRPRDSSASYEVKVVARILDGRNH